MPRQYQLISEINPQSRLWIAKVYVEDKGMPRSSPNSPAKYQRRDDQTMTRSPQTPSKYQRLTLVDPTGTKIQATIFPNDIPLFKDTLVVDKSYYISNATVSEIPLKYRSANNMFQWTINKRTLVEPVIEDNEVISIPTPTLIPFSELKEYINSAQSIDVIGIALDMNPIKEVHTPYGSQKVQEVILIDQGFTVIILTLWEQFLECESLAIMEKISTNPVILAKKLKVTPYNGLSLSMRQSTTFIINPAIPQAASLKKWSKENKKVLDQIRIEKTYKASSSNMALPASKDIIKIKDIKNLHEKEMTSWLKGKIMVTNINQKFWFMACNKCHKAQGANYNQVFKCFRCREARAIGLPRCCVEVQVMDESGSITATLFGENAEKVLSCTAKNLMENTSNGYIKNIQDIATLINNKEYIIRVKPSKYQPQSSSEIKFNVISLLDTPTIEHSTYQNVEQQDRTGQQNSEFFDMSNETLDHPATPSISQGNISDQESQVINNPSNLI